MAQIHLLFFQVLDHIILELLHRLLFFFLSPVCFDLHLRARKDLVRILFRLLLEGRIVRVQIQLKYITSIFLVTFLDDFADIYAASYSRIMVSSLRKGRSMASLAIPA